MTNAAITPHLPTSVSLYYVDYNDSLSNNKELLEESLRQNSLDPIHDKVNDWWCGYDLVADYIKEIRGKLDDEDVELSDDDEDELRDWLYDKDTSTPVNDLLGNTGKISMFYSLGLKVEGWHSGFMCAPYRNSSYAQEAYKIRRILGVKKDTKEAELIDSIVRNASYGGELRIYFSLDLEEAISGEPDKDFKQVQFKGKYAVAVYNSSEGSGDFEYMELDRTFPFIRDNLFTSVSDRYSLESCFGMCGDWLDKADEPMMSIQPLKKRATINKSENAALLTKEAEYNRVFEDGGCSAGDMDIRRHRDVYYDNNLPCGNRCPHCHTFWID